jgi:BA14K-like protein
MTHSASILSTLAAVGIGLGSLTTPSSAMSVMEVVGPVASTGDVVDVAQRDGFIIRGGDGYYNGHRGYRERHNGYRRSNGYWFPPEAFLGALIINGIIQNQQPVYRQHGMSYGDAHIQWCQNRYRSYDIRTDSYQPNYGGRKLCNSPYN